MKTVKRMTVATRLSIGFATIIIIGCIIAIIGAVRMNSLSMMLDEMANNRMVKVSQFTEVKDNLNEIARRVRNIVITDDTVYATGERNTINGLRTKNTILLVELRKTVTRPAAVELLDVIDSTRPVYNQNLDRVIEMAMSGQKEVAMKVLLGEVRGSQNKLFKAIEDSRALQKGTADQLASDAKASSSAGSTLLLALGCAMILIGCVVGWLIVRDLRRALGAEPSQLSDIAGRIADGDLSVSLSAAMNDTSSVMAAMVRMQKSLTDVVSTVREGSEAVAGASGEISQGNVNLSQRTEHQASALEQTAASMEELSSTVKQNAENTRQADHLARTASTIAAKGGDMVAKVIDTMKGINDSSSKISDIISVIDGIAFQTNILALNAAVEAARAGEQGRGFAVVATEVRNLAGRSAEAAKEIKNLISTSVVRVQEGTVLVDLAGATMTEVLDAIRRVTEIMADISSASAEQSQGVSQIGEAVQQLDQVTQENAALVEEMSAAATSLKNQAEALLRTVVVFQLPENMSRISNTSTHIKRTTTSPHPAPRGTAQAGSPSVGKVRRPLATRHLETPVGKNLASDWVEF